MTKISNWLDATHRLRVETGLAVNPVIYLSPVAPDDAFLAAIAAKERADGWSEEVVLRNSLRRNNKTRVTCTPNSITIGDTGQNTYLHKPKLLSALQRVVRLDWPQYSGSSIADLTAMLNGKAASAIRMVFRGFTEVGSGTVPIGGGSAHETQAIMASTRLDPNVFRVYCSRPQSYSNSDAGWATGYAYVDFATTPETKGLYAALLFNDGADDRLFKVFSVCAEPGFSAFLARSGRSNHAWSHAPGPWVSPPQFTVCERSILETPVDVTPFNTPNDAYHQVRGEWSTELYHIGDPEFADNVSYQASAVTVNGRTIVLSGTTMYVTWDGSRLAEMKPTLSAQQRAEVSKLKVTSRISDELYATDLTLDDLLMQKIARDADKDISSEVMVAKDPANDIPEDVTFAIAASRISRLDGRIYHKILTDRQALIPAVVRISGNVTSWTVQVVYADGTSTSVDPDEGYFWYSEGVYVDTTDFNQTGAPVDPMALAFGAGYSDGSAERKRVTRAKRHMSDLWTFGLGVPNVKALDRENLCGLLITAAAIDRKMFSSFVVGGCTMGNLARKLYF